MGKIKDTPIPTGSNGPSEASIQFMLVEMQTISDRWSDANKVAEGRLNMYITVTSGAIGFLILLNQLQISTKGILEAALITFFLIWLLGLVTFFRLMERGVVVVEYIRALNRVRRFFVDQDPKLSRYLALPASDGRPSFVGLGARKISGRVFTAIICSLSFGFLCGGVTSFSIGAQITEFTILVGITGFILHFVLAETYVTRKLHKREMAYKVFFPET